MMNLNRAAHKIATDALAELAQDPIDLYEWTVENPSDAAEYCICGYYGQVCEDVAEMQHFDKDDLIESVMTYIILGFDREIHTRP